MNCIGICVLISFDIRIILSSSIIPRIDLNASPFNEITPSLSLYLSHSAYFVVIEDSSEFTVVLLVLASFQSTVSNAFEIRTDLMSVFSSLGIQH